MLVLPTKAGLTMTPRTKARTPGPRSPGHQHEQHRHLLDKRQVCRGRAARSLSLSLLRARARTAVFPTAPSPAYPRSWLQLISSGAPLLRRRQVGASVCNANSVVVSGSDERGH